MPGPFERALDAIYRSAIATDARIEGLSVDVRVIDKSDGVATALGPRAAPTVRRPTLAPAVLIRTSELTANGLTPGTVRNKSITYNGGVWYIHATEPVSRPDGAGELRLLIRSTR